LIVYSHGSTHPANVAKIGPLDVVIINLKGIVKINKKQQQNIQLAGPAAAS